MITGNDQTEPSPLRSSRFLIFATGNAINNVGESIYATALPLVLYQLSHSLAIMSFLAAAAPSATLFAPVFGAAADRWGPRVLVVPGLLLQVAAAIALNVFLITDRGSPATLFLCALLLASGGTAYRSGWMTGIPTMFPDRPVRTRGTLNSIFFTTMLLGPGIVSVLLDEIGYIGLLWFNLATFFAPIAVWLIGVHPARIPPKDVSESARWSLREGMRAIVRSNAVLTLLVARLTLCIACGVGFDTLVVYELRNSWMLNGKQTSIALMLMSALTLAGNLAVSQRRSFNPKRSLTAGMAVVTPSLILLSVPSLPIFLTALSLVSLGVGVILSTTVMMSIKYISPRVLGRATGMIWLLTGIASVLSPAALVVLVNHLGHLDPNRSKQLILL